MNRSERQEKSETMLFNLIYLFKYKTYRSVKDQETRKSYVLQG